MLVKSWAILLAIPFISSAVISKSWAVTNKTAQLNIAATFVASCTTHSSSNISFGTLDFGSHTTLSGQPITVIGQENAGAIDIKCNKGLNYNILLDGGNSSNPQARKLQKSNTQETVNYNLYTDPQYNHIWDNQQGFPKIASGTKDIITIYGLIPSQPAPSAGVYTDTINVAIVW